MSCLYQGFCEGCNSFCPQQGAFTLHRYAKGELIVFPNSNNYMLFVLSGSINVCSEGVTISCPKREIVLLQENGQYSISTTEDCEMLVLSYIRSFQVCDKMGVDDIRDIIGDYHYEFHSLTFNSQMELFVDSVVKYVQDEVGCAYIHNAKQLELFVVCRLYYDPRVLLEFFWPTIDKGMYFQSLVRANNAKAKNVEELATLCGYNLHNFKKVFKYSFKISPYQWMLQQNKNKILALLLDDSIPIKAIAAEFDFSGQSHLNRYCKRYLGGTSAQIRSGKYSVK